MKNLIVPLLILASCLILESCSQCHERDSDCVCKPECYVKDKHCGCEKACGCRIP
ncbi:MAG: hypothetical protein JSS10_01925 [Verrucomicrobia bacterium]|nr:hypothetical protein [Verrucomicrobiota bacterium]